MTCSTRAPSMPLGLRSTSTRWLSVPPDTSVYPSSSSLRTPSLAALHLPSPCCHITYGQHICTSEHGLWDCEQTLRGSEAHLSARTRAFETTWDW